MKKALTPSEVAHAWANQTQIEAYTSSRNFYFYRETIYSYGSHFPIAKHVKNNKGVCAILLTTSTYSNTTAKHINHVKNAANHLYFIYCDNPENSHYNNFAIWINEAEQVASKLQNAKKPEIYLSRLSKIIYRVDKYANFFELQIPEKLQAILATKDKSQYAEYLAKKEAYELAEKKMKEKEKAKKHRDELKKFISGERYSMYFRNGRDYLALRNGEKGKYVITSQGVVLPFEYAKKLHDKVVSNTLKVDDSVLSYHVKEVTKTDITIGCHKFPIKYLIEWGNKNLA